VNNTRDWRLQCGGFGGGGVDLRMGSGHGGRGTGKEMTDKRSPVFVGKMIEIHHSSRDRVISEMDVEIVIYQEILFQIAIQATQDISRSVGFTQHC
jgi:hypothetical protein